jgi:hypothetical protein
MLICIRTNKNTTQAFIDQKKYEHGKEILSRLEIICSLNILLPKINGEVKMVLFKENISVFISEIKNIRRLQSCVFL